MPHLALNSEDETTLVASYAKSTGRRRLALLLIDNFELRDPPQPLSDITTELKQQLMS